jgi:hypothetical protein
VTVIEAMLVSVSRYACRHTADTQDEPIGQATCSCQYLLVLLLLPLLPLLLLLLLLLNV